MKSLQSQVTAQVVLPSAPHSHPGDRGATQPVYLWAHPMHTQAESLAGKSYKKESRESH